jgi:ribonuclease G
MINDAMDMASECQPDAWLMVVGPPAALREVSAPVLVIDEIENALNYLHGEKDMGGLTLCVHPFIHAYLTKGIPSIQQKWWWRWKKWVKVKPVGSSQYLDFTVQDGQGNEVPL